MQIKVDFLCAIRSGCAACIGLVLFLDWRSAANSCAGWNPEWLSFLLQVAHERAGLYPNMICLFSDEAEEHIAALEGTELDYAPGTEYY